MATVHAQFAEELRSRLNGQLDAVGGSDGSIRAPAAARAAQLPENVIAEAVAAVLGVAYADSLGGCHVSREFTEKIPISFARRHGIVALAGDNAALTAAIADLAAWPHVGILARSLGKRVLPMFAPRREIMKAINLAYQQDNDRVHQVMRQLDGDEAIRQVEKMSNEDLLDVSSRAPVIKLVNLILFEAVKRRASDVHIQPYEDRLVVRFRIDGVLYDVFTPPSALQAEMISRIKVMAQMNIAERRLAQDGRATVEVGDRVVDLRIATLPTSFGERAVIRLLDKSIRLYELAKLGMSQSTLESFRQIIRMDHGIVLVTGPTGSGKTTTLYAALGELNSKQMNVLTLEDPIEYRLEGISQTQISDRKGMTFAGGLRHVLRQDPDVIMVGEIRDADTAHMAVQSALTGHLVFSTLHTNDSAGAVCRLLDLGIEPYLLASSLLGVLAQRLVRKICPHCRQEHMPAPEEYLRCGLADQPKVQLYRGGGCDACLGTGYMDRAGIFEMLVVSETVRELILRKAKATSVKSAAIAAGMATLHADGIAKAREGLTTLAEVARVASGEEF